MPMPDVSGKRIFRTPISSCRNAISLRAPSDSASHSMPGVDVLGVLAEDHHVRLRRVLERARHAAEVAHRAQADVEVELLAQRHVERADAAADRRRHRALDRDRVLPQRDERLVRQPDVGAVEPGRLLAGVDLHPVDRARAAVRLRDGGVDDGLHHGRDVDADAVALDERDDRVVGNRLPGHDPGAVRGWR